VNDQVVHGIPSDKVTLKEGDIVSVDCGTFMNGFVAILLIRFVWVRLMKKS
jgi:methionine aminopeptidase